MQGLIHPMWGRGVFLFDCELGGYMHGGRLSVKSAR
jgi:hypothetical protein